MKHLKVGSDFSGVGAFDYALKRITTDFTNVFACDMDKFARQSYIHNHGEPNDYPENVYNREIPAESLDIYMTSPPCQSFSVAGKRKGKDSENGVLFFNSHEFIKKNNPRFFIFENVKGLLSDDGGNTFNEWLTMLGGKSINGNPVIFPFDESVPYHIYWKVLNSKKHGVPQNRERVFIVGIRDDEDNHFTWPKEEHLTKKLKDILEDDVDDKHFLSEKMLEKITFEAKKNGEIANLNKGGERGAVYSSDSEIMSCLSATDYKQPKQISVIQLNDPKHSNNRIYHENGCSPTLNTMQGGNRQPFVATDKICIPVLTPERTEKRQNGRRFKKDGEEAFTVTTQDRHGVYDGFKIRKLTPRECFRLQDFPDDFEFVVSNSQLYKQAGNSITVRVLELILRKLNL